MTKNNPTIRERIASLETLVKELIQSNKEDHKEIKDSLNSLSKNVNEEIFNIHKRLIKAEKNIIRLETMSGLFWRIVAIIISPVVTSLLTYILMKIIGAI